MFNTMIFEFGMDGKLLAKPLELKVSDIRGKHFTVYSSTYRGDRHELPAIQIGRSYVRLSTDPWNEDGRPPSLMTQIINPHSSYYCWI